VFFFVILYPFSNVIDTDFNSPKLLLSKSPLSSIMRQANKKKIDSPMGPWPIFLPIQGSQASRPDVASCRKYTMEIYVGQKEVIR
jgi:hypothetical protein